MKISDECSKEQILEFKQAAEWMVEGANMHLDLIEKEEQGIEVTKIERIDARTMLNKGVIAIDEFNKTYKEQQVKNRNRQQRRSFNKHGSK